MSTRSAHGTPASKVLFFTIFCRKCAATETSRNVERIGPAGAQGVTPCREHAPCSRHFREHGFAFHDFLPQVCPWLLMVGVFWRPWLLMVGPLGFLGGPSRPRGGPGAAPRAAGASDPDRGGV